MMLSQSILLMKYAAGMSQASQHTCALNQKADLGTLCVAAYMPFQSEGQPGKPGGNALRRAEGGVNILAAADPGSRLAELSSWDIAHPLSTLCTSLGSS
jgi:hypothetical protein